MIQRIQSIYLVLTTILAGLFLTGDIFKFIDVKGSEFLMNINGIFQFTEGSDSSLIIKTLPLLILALLIPIVSLISIFLFRKRKLQIKFTLILFIINLILIAIAGFYGSSFANQNQAKLFPQFEMFIPLINLILILLAYKGIKKDDNLVRSYDRLR